MHALERLGKDVWVALDGLLLPHSFRQDLSLNPKLTILAKLAGQQTQMIYLSVLVNIRVTGTHGQP